MPRPAPFIITPSADFLSQNHVLVEQAGRLVKGYEDRSELVEDQHLQAIGTALWEALQLDDTLIRAKQKAGIQPLPVIIKSNDAAIQALPWETLYHPELKQFLGRSAGFSLSRCNPDFSPDISEAEQTPLRVLLFTSLPDDLVEQERLDVEDEQAAVQEALLAYEQKGEVVLEMPDDGRFESFQTSLRDFQPHLVYLSGHGQFIHEHHNSRAWGSFLFEDQWGAKRTVAEDEIHECFQNTGVRLLVVSACQSAKHHPDYPENGLSQRIYQSGVPYVIGMRESVMDKAAIRFAHALLQGIGKRQTVDVALQEARAAIVKPLEDDTGRYTDPIRARISLGQWCLPQLLSHDLDQDLIDWSFTPHPRQYRELKAMLGKVAMPDRFIGRRRDLRRWQNDLRTNKLNRLLVTGAGGMGKTALAGKLINTLRKDGYETYSFSLLPKHNWQDTLIDMEMALAEVPNLYERYQIICRKGLSPQKEAEFFLKFLLERHNGKVILFFDNLESVQECQSPHSLTDANLVHWIAAACEITEPGLKLILTSRWRIPDWPDEDHYQIGRPVYGDYLAFARLRQLSTDKEQLRRVYQTLGGNFRALEFFITATKGMNIKNEKIFLDKLKDAEAEIQTNMALAEVVAQRSHAERELLNRLMAYQTPAPLDGVTVLFLSAELPHEKQMSKNEVTTLLQNLLDVSLVEQYRSDKTGETEYGLSPLVRSWLQKNGAGEPDRLLLRVAAEFLLWLWDADMNTSWRHLMATHQALLTAGLEEKRQKLVLDWIVGPLNRDGMYQHLLDEWLLPLGESEDPMIRSKVLGQIGKQYLHLGDYEIALKYLKKSLSIQQEIGDKSGEGTTLNNMAGIYRARGDYETALEYLKKSLSIRQEIGDKSGEGTTLNNISQIYDARGDYETALEYLKKSLSIRQEIGDKSGEGTTLNNMATTAHARGDYETALEYLKKSLSIRQEIGDVAGLCATLFNIGHIHLQNKEQKEAVQAWVTVYRIAKKSNLAQALEALENLAENLGLPGGLDGWGKLGK